MYSKIDPMLDKASLCLQVDCDIKYHIQMFEVKPSQMHVEDYFLSEEECYDELWMFRIEWWIAKILHTMSLRFNIERVINKQWYGAAPLSHGLLI